MREEKLWRSKAQDGLVDKLVVCYHWYEARLLLLNSDKVIDAEDSIWSHRQADSREICKFSKTIWTSSNHRVRCRGIPSMHSLLQFLTSNAYFISCGGKGSNRSRMILSKTTEIWNKPFFRVPGTCNQVHACCLCWQYDRDLLTVECTLSSVVISESRYLIVEMECSANSSKAASSWPEKERELSQAECWGGGADRVEGCLEDLWRQGCASGS